MNTKEGFEISAFRMLLSAASLAIMIPMVKVVVGISFYVTVCVYILGKFVDLVAKVKQRQNKLFFVIYIIGILISILAIGMCFWGFANAGTSETVTNTPMYNIILLIMAVAICAIDIADFIFCICRLNYTKEKLQQFDE